MPFPADFQFSQHNLQDFLDCPRRFQLRYVLKQGWPALQSEPVQQREHHALMGVRFHQMIHQQHLGIDTAALTESNFDTDLNIWWQRYLEDAPTNLPDRRLTEFTLSAPFAGFRILAKYDFLAVEPGERLVIVDWKTGGRPPSRQVLSQRVQTQLYPLLIVLAGHIINDNKPIAPDQIEMIYWFASQPDHQVVFSYSESQYDSDRQEFSTLIQKISSLPNDGYALTSQEKACAFCNYRSLCDRGERAGLWTDLDDQPEESELPDIDLGQVGEIHF